MQMGGVNLSLGFQKQTLSLCKCIVWIQTKNDTVTQIPHLPSNWLHQVQFILHLVILHQVFTPDDN